MSQKPLLQTLQGQILPTPPLWLMRQAGRYLPEYRELRSQNPSLLDFFLAPKKASLATLQPLSRFPLDAAIVFSDILILPYALGRQLSYQELSGPSLNPLSPSDISTLSSPSGALLTAAETISITTPSLSPTTAMIGFAGSPWTVACYMIEGSHTPQFPQALSWLHHNPQALKDLIDTLTSHTLTLLLSQIKAGAHAVQIFDSWAGLVGHHHFDEFIIQPTRYIVDAIHTHYPHVPVIGFPRCAGFSLVDYILHTSVDAVSLDPHTSPHTLRTLLPPSHASLPLQGNIHPLTLLHGGDTLQKSTQELLALTHNTPHIVNLGHGILKDTPISHVEDLIHLVKNPQPCTPS